MILGIVVEVPCPVCTPSWWVTVWKQYIVITGFKKEVARPPLSDISSKHQGDKGDEVWGSMYGRLDRVGLIDFLKRTLLLYFSTHCSFLDQTCCIWTTDLIQFPVSILFLIFFNFRREKHVTTFVSFVCLVRIRISVQQLQYWVSVLSAQCCISALLLAGLPDDYDGKCCYSWVTRGNTN